MKMANGHILSEFNASHYWLNIKTAYSCISISWSELFSIWNIMSSLGASSSRKTLVTWNEFSREPLTQQGAGALVLWSWACLSWRRDYFGEVLRAPCLFWQGHYGEEGSRLYKVVWKEDERRKAQIWLKEAQKNSSSGTGSSVRLCSFHPCTFSTPSWMKPWTTWSKIVAHLLVSLQSVSSLPFVCYPHCTWQQERKESFSRNFQTKNQYHINRIYAWEATFDKNGYDATCNNEVQNIIPNPVLQLLTCFPCNNIDGSTGRAIACTIEGRNIYMVASIGLQIFHFGWVFLIAHLHTLCSCFFIMSSPVTNL